MLLLEAHNPTALKDRTLNILISLSPYNLRNVGIEMLKRKMLQGLKAAVYGGLIFGMLAGRKALYILLLIYPSSDATVGRDLVILGR